MRSMASPSHKCTKYNTCRNISGIDNRTQPSEFQVTEEELAASEYELSEVEAQLLHLKDRKQLLLERIGRLNDGYNQHVNHDGSSTVKSTTLIDFGEQNRENGRKLAEVASGKRKALYINDSKWYQTPVISNCYEILSHKEGNYKITPRSQVA
jgi:hypothetical protein